MITIKTIIIMITIIVIATIKIITTIIPGFCRPPAKLSRNKFDS
jgi:hypothetical protein